MRLPADGRARSRLLEHLVDLLEREALGLGHEEVGEDDAEGACSSPDKEDFGAHVAGCRVDHVRCDVADNLLGN